MAPIFASPDIAALVAAFPPPSPIRKKASLLRSRSGGSLRRSSLVQASFRDLIESSNSRISLSDLPYRLDIDNTDWLFSCYDRPLAYSRDGKSVIPSSELSSLRESLLKRLEDAPVDLTAIVRQEDISLKSLKDLLEECTPNATLHHWQDPAADGIGWRYSETFLKRIEGWMHSLPVDCWTEGIDMGQHYPDIPPALLLHLAKTVSAGVPTPKRRWELLNGRAVFIPSSFDYDLENNSRAAQKAQADDLVEQLVSKGFCRILTPADHDDPSHGLVDDVIALYTQRALPGDEVSDKLQEVPMANYSAMVLVKSAALDRACETLRAAAPQEAARVWHARDGPESTLALKAAAFESLEREINNELARLHVLSSIVHRREVEDIVITSINKLEREDSENFKQATRIRCLAPIQLYAAGIGTVGDESLKQHLEEHLGEHFRREVIPATMDWLREQRLLLDKSRRKDVEKMSAACAEAKSLSELQTAVSKMAKKQKVGSVSTEELEQYKQESLRQKAKAIRKLSRGSDLLQNLIWIKLAEATGGLYMSSGKDTTRMIKHYQVVGDVQMGQKLEKWRDDLKAGKEGKEMLEEMRGLALGAVAEMCGCDGGTKAA